MAIQKFTGPEYGKVSAFLQITDVLLIAGSLWLTSLLYELPWVRQYTIVLVWTISMFLLVVHFSEIYRAWRGSLLRGRELLRLMGAWFTVVLTLLILAYTTKTTSEYSRRLFLTWFVITPLVLVVWRGWLQIFLGEMRKRGWNVRTVAIVGASELGAHLANTILESPWMGLRPLGFYDARRPSGVRPLHGGPIGVLGNLDALIKHAHEGRIDMVYIALPMRAETRIGELIAKLSDTTVSVYLVPDFFMFDLLHASWGNVGDLPVVSISETPFYGVDGFVKRLEDISLSGLFLLLVAIPMIIIAIGVKLSSPGPIIFRQHRYGLRGNRISVWKFRTMTVSESDATVVQAKKNDPRVTRIGAFLRRTSLDELPQLINVLEGKMSLVGPRPHAVAHNEQYRKQVDRYMLRHKVKPGITGLAQVNGWRGETDTLDKMQMRIKFDLAYIQNWSLYLDLKIIYQTMFKVISDRNAY
ncbi:MAG: undecaprenyl-phosphate glucose phosphotransferase [Sulfuricaulis sp.]|nr:undecaprenyl-phosphate glucose phosphotransferase [Sulfuricaulis sp.]